MGCSFILGCPILSDRIPQHGRYCRLDPKGCWGKSWDVAGAGCSFELGGPIRSNTITWPRGKLVPRDAGAMAGMLYQCLGCCCRLLRILLLLRVCNPIH